MLNYKTYKQLDQQCLDLSGVSDSQINLGVRQMIINDRVFRLYSILHAHDDPWYDRITTLTVATDLQHEYWNSNGVPGIIPIDGIIAAANTIKRSTGAFVAGQIIFVQYTNFNALFLSNSDWFVARITTGGAMATYQLLDGTDLDTNVDLAAGVIILNKMSANAVDISTLYIKRIIGIFDDQGGGSGNDREFYEIADPINFDKSHRNSFWNGVVAWNFYRGDSIRFRVGANADPMGVVQMHYKGKPGVYTDAGENNTIDIPPEENQTLLDECVYGYLQQGKMEGTIATLLQERHDAFEKRYSASQMETAKAIERKGGRG
jgi:hypothetical protein